MGAGGAGTRLTMLVCATGFVAAMVGMRAAAGGAKAGLGVAVTHRGLAAGDNAQATSGRRADPAGAVGRSHYVEFVNSVVRVYNKADLTAAGPATQLDTFVNHPGDAVFD